MPTLALVFLLQAAAATPTPTPTSAPAPRRTPVTASGTGTARTLSDVARDRKLQGRDGEATPKPAALTVAPAGGGIGGKGTPAASPSPAATPGAGLGPAVVVESAEHNGSVGASGQVRVFGTVRNAGDGPACDVTLAVRLYDDRDRYLVSGGGKLDEPILKPGARSSFSVVVQVPPGVAGSLREKSLGQGTTGGSVTLEGHWRMLGRAEAEVISVAEACPGEKSLEGPAVKAPEPAPVEKPTATPR